MHADASKQSNAWAKENAALSGVPEGSIRYLLDDALKFTQREVRRGSIYDGIILDPPAFGRGPNGETWKIEEDLEPLLAALAKMLSPKPGSFFLLNGYAAGYSPQSFLQAVESFFPDAASAREGEFGELQIKETGSGKRVVPSGIYVRFVR
jgi:23S rRNA (cytosine1962-C5)-methyltransferase